MGKALPNESAQAMNSLMAGEMKKAGLKVASDKDIQAFKDHQEYLDTLADALNSDKSESWAPNDPTKD